VPNDDIINAAYADIPIDFQEFMIIPVGGGYSPKRCAAASGDLSHPEEGAAMTGHKYQFRRLGPSPELEIGGRGAGWS